MGEIIGLHQDVPLIEGTCCPKCGEGDMEADAVEVRVEHEDAADITIGVDDWDEVLGYSCTSCGVFCDEQGTWYLGREVNY